MKKSKIMLLAILASNLIFAYSCVKCDLESDKFAEEIPNQVIIRFIDKADSASIQNTIKKLREHSDTVYKCMCGDDLILVEYPKDPGITLNDRLASAQGDIAHNDNGEVVGNVFKNIRIILDQSDSVVNDIDTVFDRRGPTNSIIVAVIDGGISKSTEDNLQGNIWANPDEVKDEMDSDNNCLEDDFNGYDFTRLTGDTELNAHGTVVSKLMINSVPRASRVKFMDLRIFDLHGKSSLFYALCATQYAIDKNADIINMSWGYYASEPLPLHLEYIRRTTKARITVIASAGNDSVNTDICHHFPSGFNKGRYDTRNVIGVAALDSTSTNSLAHYSNYGRSTIQLAAPGTHHFQGSLSVEGTSYSAPIVTAAAIRYMIDKNTRNSVDVVQCLKNSVVPTNPKLTVISGGKLDVNLINSCP